MLRIFRRGEASKSQGPEFGGVMVGERPWLVLGGGGLKGLAHLGAWRALRDAGFEPEGILGTSIGALVGACLAGGQQLDGNGGAGSNDHPGGHRPHAQASSVVTGNSVFGPLP